jgi:pyrroline-5-carboxylate reductase
MGGALAAAAAKNVSPKEIAVSGRDAGKTASFAEKLGCAALSNTEIASSCKYIVLGVKPQVLPGVLEETKPVLKKRKDRFVLVSMAAGMTISALADMAGGGYPVIRIMPNTPVSVGAGMTPFCASGSVDASDKAEFLSLLSAAGLFDEIPESLIDAAGSVSGCGPAFTCMFIEALADGAVECGVPRSKALEYAAQMVYGTSCLLLSGGSHPGALKDAVCSPGGTTIAGVHALESGAFRSLAMGAVTAAYKRTL